MAACVRHTLSEQTEMPERPQNCSEPARPETDIVIQSPFWRAARPVLGRVIFVFLGKNDSKKKLGVSGLWPIDPQFHF